MDELAEYMNISEDEVEDILRLAGEIIPEDEGVQNEGASGTLPYGGAGNTPLSEDAGEAGENGMTYRVSSGPDRKGRKSFYNPAGRIRRR